MIRKLLKAALVTLLSPLPEPQHPTLRGGSGLFLRWRWGWIRGWLRRPFWLWSKLLGGPRVVVGRRFSLQGKLIFSGPGTVTFGDDVVVDMVCTPFTHSPSARIHIGSRTFLNGTRFGCVESIVIGDDCIIADARILDSDYHALHKGRNQRGAIPKQAPISIGNNVWIASDAVVMKGVTIGDDSVIGLRSVVIKSVPAGRIFAGFPARDLGEVPLE